MSIPHNGAGVARGSQRYGSRRNASCQHPSDKIEWSGEWSRQGVNRPDVMIGKCACGQRVSSQRGDPHAKLPYNNPYWTGPDGVRKNALITEQECRDAYRKASVGGEGIITRSELAAYANAEEKCFACGKRLGANPRLADTRDGQTAYVGSECWKMIAAAGERGWQPERGGPKLYPMPKESLG